MKPMKLTSLMVMLLVGFSAAAQEEFFDDVYFSSSKKDKKEKTEEKVIQPKEDAERTTMTSTYSTSKRKSAVSDEERDVDEYNRRYTSVDVEEPYDEDSDGEILAEYNDDMDNEKTVASDSKKERRSDTEYTERIIRYHSPSKITIAGADQVDLYLSDGYYAYGYDTDYSNGSTNVSVNVNIGNGWGGYYDPWYSGWYGGWYGGWYDPWIYSPARYWGYGPSFGFGWGWGGFYAGYWGPSWGWGPSYWGPGYWGGGYWGHHHHHHHYYASPYRHYSAGLAVEVLVIVLLVRGVRWLQAGLVLHLLCEVVAVALRLPCEIVELVLLHLLFVRLLVQA